MTERQQRRMSARRTGRSCSPLGALGRVLLLHRDRARDGAPFTLVLIRVALAAAMLWAVPAGRGASGCRCRRARRSPSWSSPCSTTSSRSSLFAWAQEEITGGLASILNATTPIWGVLVAHLFTADEKATPEGGRRAARLRGRRGDDRRAICSASIGASAAGPARLPRRDALLRAGRRLGAALPAHGRAADRGLDRPAHRRGDRDAAAGAAVRAALARGGAVAPRPGSRSPRWRCSAPASPTSSISACSPRPARPIRCSSPS